LWNNANRVARWLERKGAAPRPRDPTAPPDCRSDRWATAFKGSERFVADGWASKATALGWTFEELFRVPSLWSQIYLTGAALLIGDKKVIAVTEASIAVETQSGSRLKFRRIGREHLA
jgi:hypothetical protein